MHPCHSPQCTPFLHPSCTPPCTPSPCTPLAWNHPPCRPSALRYLPYTTPPHTPLSCIQPFLTHNLSLHTTLPHCRQEKLYNRPEGPFTLATFTAISSAIFFFWWMWTSIPVTMFRRGIMHSAHSLVIHSFTSFKRRKSHWNRSNNGKCKRALTKQQLQQTLSWFFCQDYDEVDNYPPTTNGFSQKSPKNSYNSLPLVNFSPNNRRESTVTLSLSSSASSLQFNPAWFDRVPTQRKRFSFSYSYVQIQFILCAPRVMLWTLINDVSDHRWGVRLSTGKKLRRRHHQITFTFCLFAIKVHESWHNIFVILMLS
jgi:hypothetical protein